MRSRPGSTVTSKPAVRSSGRKRSTRTWYARLPSSAEALPHRRSMPDDLDPLEQHLLTAIAALTQTGAERSALPEAEALWQAQVTSRHCDLAARWLQREGRSYYTIGSAGHESNAVVALALRPSDPALLHYRSGAFYLARAAQAGRDGVPDVLFGVTAARDEPIAGGRHKVFGHPDLAVIPQTSTIASHLPRAVGVAFAIDRARKLGVECAWPGDAVVVCSFGDASVNHADRAGRAEHGRARCTSAPARAPALRVRGQRSRDQRSVSPRLGGGCARLSRRPQVRGRGGGRSGRRARGGAGARRVGARGPAPGSAPPPHGPVPGSRREPMSSLPTVHPPRSEPTFPMTRCSQRPRGSSRTACAPSIGSRPSIWRPASACARSLSGGTAATARDSCGGDAAARAPVAGGGRRAGARRGTPRTSLPPSR